LILDYTTIANYISAEKSKSAGTNIFGLALPKTLDLPLYGVWSDFQINSMAKFPLIFYFQMHPLGLCNMNDDDDLHEYGWVGVVKLEEPQLTPQPCMSVYQKVSLIKTFSLTQSNFIFGQKFAQVFYFISWRRGKNNQRCENSQPGGFIAKKSQTLN
jgi:hypothetical protein